MTFILVCTTNLLPVKLLLNCVPYPEWFILSLTLEFPSVLDQLTMLLSRKYFDGVIISC